MTSLETVIQSANLGLNSRGRFLEWDWDLCDFSKTGSIRNCSVVVVMAAEFFTWWVLNITKHISSYLNLQWCSLFSVPLFTRRTMREYGYL